MIHSIYKKYEQDPASTGYENKVVTQSRFGTLSEIREFGKADILEINHPRFDARISKFGGQVLLWNPKPYGPVLWSSKTEVVEKDKTVRGGTAVFWPQFCRNLETANQGFANNHKWLLKDIKFESDFVELKLVLFGNNCSENWPHPFKLVQVIRFSDTLTQELRYTNFDSSKTGFSQSMCNYFKVSSPENVVLPELNRIWFDDNITERLGCKPQELRNLEGPIDRIYHHDNTLTLIDKGLSRAIEISKFNSPQWEVWNPGEDLASTLDDIHQQGEQEFVCVQAGNTSWVEVAPNQTASFGQTIKVYNL